MASHSGWAAAAADEHARRQSHPFPNIFSAEYDPFAPPQTSMPFQYSSSALYDTSAGPASLTTSSPALSCVDSARSSFSSATASDTYSHQDVYGAYQPRIKSEDHLDWQSDSGTSVDYSVDGGIVMSASPSFPGYIDTAFFGQEDNLSWHKPQEAHDVSLHDTTPRIAADYTECHQDSDQRKILSNATRTRTPRKMTTREDANFQCKVKGCGKLFSRSYNYKAHLETHSTSREYPFPCPLDDCNKKFVRKTDLQRHHASVHEKTRNYQCDFCSRYFARKDTLRRHMEDGCSKRFDLNVAFSSSYLGNEATVSKSQAALLPIQTSYGATVYSTTARSPTTFAPNYMT